jgi:hypothetical protein
MGFASLMGMANPSPSTPETDIFTVLIPITCPLELTRAPPLLPGFMAASV